MRMHLRICGLLAVLALLVLLLPAAAMGDATSGRKYKGTVGTTDVCSEAVIASVADNRAYTTSWYTGCITAKNSSSGYLGVRAFGWKDGYFCNATSWYYNSSTTWSFGVGTELCSNPPGTQSFYTTADSRYWNGSSYTDFTGVNSPSQNY